MIKKIDIPTKKALETQIIKEVYEHSIYLYDDRVVLVSHFLADEVENEDLEEDLWKWEEVLTDSKTTVMRTELVAVARSRMKNTWRVSLVTKTSNLSLTWYIGKKSDADSLYNELCGYVFG